MKQLNNILVFTTLLCASITWASSSSIGSAEVDIGGTVLSGGCRFNPLDSQIIDFRMYPSDYFYPNNPNGQKETGAIETRIQLVCSNLPSSAISIHFTSEHHTEDMLSNELKTGRANLSAFVQMNGKDVSFNNASGESYDTNANGYIIKLSTKLKATGTTAAYPVDSGMIKSNFTIHAEYR